jgi:hypothetical protein
MPIILSKNDFETQSRAENNDINNISKMLVDLISGDTSILEREEFKAFDVSFIKKALDFLLSNEKLSDTQKGYLLSNTWRINYRDRPPTVEEFLTPKYLGRTSDYIYDRVKKTFIAYMDESKPYRDLILYPMIGWGKSFLSTLINIYVGIHLSLMRDPRRYFGLSPAAKLTQLLVSYSLKKSSEILLEPLLAIIEASPFFEKVHTREGMVNKDLEFVNQSSVEKIFWTTATVNKTSAVEFSNGANFKLVSSVHNILGLTVVTGTMTELAFFRDAGKSDDYIMRVFNDLKKRVMSRMKGNYFGRTILDSSPNTLESPIDDYICNQADKDPKNFIVRGALWDWVPEDYGEGLNNRFPIYRGGKGKPPKILDDSSVRDYDPTDLLWVPVKDKQYFIDDLFKSLKDLAGIPAGSQDKIFYDYDKIEECFEPRLKNLYTHITAPSTEDPKNLIWNQVKDLFFKKIGDKYEFYYKPWLPRAFAIDQSISKDFTAISVAHVEKNLLRNELMYVVDFTVVIAPKSSRINLDAVKLFICELASIGHMYFIAGSYDHFQSEPCIQYLERAGFEIEHLSVDISIDPYMYLLSMVEKGLLRMGRNLHFKNNLKSLQFSKRKTTNSIKVDHSLGEFVQDGDDTWEKSLIGLHGKDCSDTVAAVIDILRRKQLVSMTNWDPNKDLSFKKYDDTQRSVDSILKSMKLQVTV